MVQKGNGKIIKIIVYVLLRLMGIFETKRNSTWYAIVYMSCMIFCTFGGVIGFLNTHETVAKVDAFSVLILLFAANLMFLNTIYHKNNILQLLHTLKGEGKFAFNIVDQIDDSGKTKIILLMCTYLALAFLFPAPNLINMFNPSFTVEDDKYRNIIPYWFSCGDDNDDIPTILNTLCWKCETTVEVVLKNCLQVVLASMEYLVYCYCVILYSIVMAEFYVHNDIFKSKIQDVVHYAESFSNCESRQAKEKKDKRMENELENIIQHQQYLKRCVREIITALNGFMNLFISEFFLACVILIFSSFNEEGSFTLVFKRVDCCIHGLISFTLACFYAQTMMNLNDTVFEEISKIPWHNQSIQFRKNYCILLTQNCVQIEMKFFNLSTLNRRFLLSAYRTAYSVLNVMSLSLKK